MTPDQVKAVQESFSKVAPISEQAAELFYGRLFEIARAMSEPLVITGAAIEPFRADLIFGRALIQRQAA